MRQSELDLILKQEAEVKELIKSVEYLTAWEENFCRNIQRLLAQKTILSVKQSDLLAKLVVEVSERFD